MKSGLTTVLPFQPLTMNPEFEVIDLTDSFTLNDHTTSNSDANVIIIELGANSAVPKPAPRRSIWYKQSYGSSSSTNILKEPKYRASCELGNCPICWGKLGTKPLVSTKCGHVFCLTCLEKVMSHKRECPTCRCSLRGDAAYHPLYLPLK